MTDQKLAFNVCTLSPSHFDLPFKSGVNVMITIFGDMGQFSEIKAIFLENFMITLWHKT
jgi:hypothetical protein